MGLMFWTSFAMGDEASDQIFQRALDVLLGREEITAMGTGTSTRIAQTDAERYISAEQNAQHDAARKLAETLGGVIVEGETILQLGTIHEEFREKLERFRVRYTEQVGNTDFQHFSDGSIIAIVKLRIPLKDIANRKAQQDGSVEDEQPQMNSFPPESVEKAVKKIIESLRPHANPQQTCALYGIQRRGKRDKHLERELSVALDKAKIFKRVARGEKLQKAREEMKLTQSDFFERKTRQQIGNNIGAELILFGAVEEGEQFAKLYLTLEVAKTGIILWEGDTYITKHSRWKPLCLSMLVPGWGQLYKGETIKGPLFLGGEALCISSAILMNQWSDDVFANFNAKPPGEEKESLRKKAKLYNNISRAFASAAVVVYAWNLLDATKPLPREISETKSPALRMRQNGLTVNYIHRF